MMISMTPRDPLITRDGRPNDGRSESSSVDFPYPSTFAGAIRTAIGSQGRGFDSALADSLLSQVSIRGPLLLRRTFVGDELLVPAPLDVVFLGNDNDGVRWLKLQCIEFEKGVCSSAASGLSVIGFSKALSSREKPYGKAPKFWPWSIYAHWLENGSLSHDHLTLLKAQRSAQLLERESRVHVALDENGVAREGQLFETTGVRLPEDTQFAVDVNVCDAQLGAVPLRLRALGGERRLAYWDDAQCSLPVLPEWLLSYVEETEKPRLRVSLLTPAYVNESVRPEQLTGNGCVLLGAKVDRPRIVSGWDLKAKMPKGTRRLVPSGSVYWVELRGASQERRAWVERMWMQNMGDDPQLCRDGFGLVALGKEGAS